MCRTAEFPATVKCLGDGMVRVEGRDREGTELSCGRGITQYKSLLPSTTRPKKCVNVFKRTKLRYNNSVLLKQGLSKDVFSIFQVKSLATSCPEELSKGNVLAWPDFLSGIVGKVKIDSKSIFCSG